MYVLTTIPELPTEVVVMGTDHPFYEAKQSDITFNYATFCANWHRLQDITCQLGWGEHTVYHLLY